MIIDTTKLKKALKAALDYMDRQYDGYYRERNESDRRKVEEALVDLQKK